MKNTILTVLLIAGLFTAQAQTKVIVKSQGQRIELDSAKVAYVLANAHNAQVTALLKSGTKSITNNDMADLILAVLKKYKADNQISYTTKN